MEQRTVVWIVALLVMAAPAIGFTRPTPTYVAVPFSEDREYVFVLNTVTGEAVKACNSYFCWEINKHVRPNPMTERQ